MAQSPVTYTSSMQPIEGKKLVCKRCKRVYNYPEAGARPIRCECGFVARADSDDEVITIIRGHMAEDHPALLETVADDELRGWIELE